MWSPQALFCVLILLAVVGAACLVGMAVYWRSAAKYVSDMWAKLVTESVQILSGGASIGSAFAAAADKPEWFRPAVAGSVSLGIWKIVQVLADYRAKSADKFNKAELASAERQGKLRTNLLSFLRSAVNAKVKRLQKEVNERGMLPSIVQVRKALTPKPHLDDLLNSFGLFLQQQLPDAESQPNNFRLGVYVDQAGVMTPVHGISLNDPGYNPFSSYEAHKEHFYLESEATPAYVVRAVRQKGMLIVEDCQGLALNGQFFYFNEAQLTYLRSMAIYYIGEVCEETGTMKKAALVVDTDVPGFFREADRTSLEFCFREFRARIKLEMFLLALLAKRGP